MNIRFIADFTIPENDFYEYESEEALFEEIWEYAWEYGLRKYKYNCETEVFEIKEDKMTEEKLYKQCRLCGCYYDVDEDSGEQLCNKCFLETKEREVKNDNTKTSRM